jgi:phosphoribosylformylglycinamidine cyclo-ligase
MDYAKAGVDIHKGDMFVNNIGSMMKHTFTSEVKNDLTSFSALYDVGPFYLSACTDGVGTKLMLAQELNEHRTIGQDLVAMNVNDLICNGAKPIFFLDYIACHKLDLKVMEDIVFGITYACKETGSSLIGGETAEMNDLYQKDHYDLAGFAIGMLEKDKLIDGKGIKPGQKLIAIKGDGFHSNGYSLIRKLLKNDDIELKKDLLRPTPIYVNLIQSLLSTFPNTIKGIANITGGGVHNISRMNKNMGYVLNNLYAPKDLPKFMQTIIDRANLSKEELYKTFNMGMGMVLCVDDQTDFFEYLIDHNIEFREIGYTTKDNGIVF